MSIYVVIAVCCFSFGVVVPIATECDLLGSEGETVKLLAVLILLN
jgi:hypothetical protein